MAGMQRHRLDLLLINTVPWAAVLSSVHGLNFGSMRHTGLMWLLTLFAAVPLLVLRGGKKITFPWLCWAPFFLICFVSLTWSDLSMTYNIQLFMQMFVFYVMGMLASTAIESEEDVASWTKSYTIALTVIAVLCLFFKIGPGKAFQGGEDGKYFGFADRPAAMTLIVIGAVFLSQFQRSPKTAIIGWFGCLAVGILSGSRMVSVVTLLLWMIHPRLASLRTRALVSIFMMVVGLAAFHTPIIQDRFFQKESGFSGSGSISDVLEGKFDSAGRFESWPKILEKSTDYPWFGHGLGQSVPFVYRVWAPMDKPHNEYLKTLFDTGYFGMGSFVLGLLGTWWNLARVVRRSQGPSAWVAQAAYMGHVGFILMAICDNPLVYATNFLDPLFVLIGAANALAARQVQAALPPIQPSASVQRRPPMPPRPALIPLR